MGPVAYRLKLPAKSNAHDVFHISALRKYESDSRVPEPSAPVLVNDVEEYFVEKILDERYNKKKHCQLPFV